MTQEKILKLIASRDPRAMATLFDTYSKSLFSIISNQVRDPQQAQNVLLEVFSRISPDLQGYDESKVRLFTWLLGITREAVNGKIANAGPDRQGLSTSFITLAADPAPGNRINTIGIGEFVKKLKPKYIQLVELLFFRGLSTDQASAHLGLTPQEIRTQNRECINDLRNYLQL